MKELLKIFSVLFFISLITFSGMNVFAEDLASSNHMNDTNITNTTNGTNTTVTSNAIVQPMTATGLTVTPTSINLGVWPSDGIEHTYTSVTNVTVTAWGLTGNLTVRASGDFISGTNRIPLNNFKYDCPGYINSKTSFTTVDSIIDDYTYLIYYHTTYTMDYYLTIPIGTTPGTYSTNITYAAYP